VNPAPSSYAFIAAAKAGGGDLGKLVHAFTGAVWRDMRDIAEDDEIAPVWRKPGFDPGLAGMAMLQGAEEYARNLEDAVSAGVFGAPFYIVDGTEKFWGQDRIDDLDLHLGQAVREGIAVWGPEGAPQVFLLHCTLAHGGAWKNWRGILSDRFRLIAPDMVGTGRGPPGDRTRDFHDQARNRRSRSCRRGRCISSATVSARRSPCASPSRAPERVASLTLYRAGSFRGCAGRGRERRAQCRDAGPDVADDRGGRHRAGRAVFLSVWGSGRISTGCPRPRRRAWPSRCG
jgi:hypothetical protein